MDMDWGKFDYSNIGKAKYNREASKLGRFY